MTAIRRSRTAGERGGQAAADGSWAAEHSMLPAVAWPLLITAVFLPLAARRHRNLSR